MAIAFANGQSNSADVSTTTVVSSYNAGSGNKIIAAVGGETTGATQPSSITHGASNFTRIIGVTDGSGGTENFAELWYADGLSGTADVTATWSDAPTGTQRSLLVIQMSGAASGGPTDTASGGAVIATLDVIINLTQANMTAVGMFSYAINENITTSQVGQNEILDANPTSSGQMMSEKGEASSGNSTSGASGSLARRFAGVLAGFEEAAAGGGRIMSSLVGPGGLVSSGGIAGRGGGLVG